MTANTVLPVDGDRVRNWFSDPVAVSHYARAARQIGLWRSEEAVFRQIFPREARVLDVGCGAGRIALGLWRLGFRELAGVDFCPPLIAEARHLAEACHCPFVFEVGDATALPYDNSSFAGAIFGFNGWMQIPGRARRRVALAELHRVVSEGGRIVFTTHDRDLESERAQWRQEKALWETATQSPELLEFGDRVLELPEGRVFMHLPDRGEVLEDLAATGWTHEFDALRSELANESAEVRQFSDECRFWVARA